MEENKVDDAIITEKEQSANSKAVCASCGAPFDDGMAFCQKCGPPKNEVKTFCHNCGAEMTKSQEFCPKCGQKRGVILQLENGSAIAEFNKQIEVNEQKKKINKKIMALSLAFISLFVVVIGVLAYTKLYLISGTYASEISSMAYTFDDGYYTYLSDDDDSATKETGKYELKIGEVTLIDDKGEKTVFNRMGKFLFRMDLKFEQEFDAKSNQEQKFTYNSYSDVLETDFTLELDGNGNFNYLRKIYAVRSYIEYEYYIYAGSIRRKPVKKTKKEELLAQEQSGTYEVSGSKIILNESGGEKYTYIIKDKHIYFSVLEKVKK